MTEKLLPCPFCGSDPELIISYPPFKSAFINCASCETSSRMSETSQEATAAWNQRAESAEPPKLDIGVIDFQWREIQRLDDSYRMFPHQELANWAYNKGFNAAPVAAQPSEADGESEDQWRKLALQFDGHRMQALGWLKATVDRLPEQVAEPIKEFLKAPPLPGEQVLAERIAAMTAQPSVPWENFPGYLIDHCEGDIITEEGLQHALSSMLMDPQYNSPTPPADGERQ